MVCACGRPLQQLRRYCDSLSGTRAYAMSGTAADIAYGATNAVCGTDLVYGPTTAPRDARPYAIRGANLAYGPARATWRCTRRGATSVAKARSIRPIRTPVCPVFGTGVAPCAVYTLRTARCRHDSRVSSSQYSALSGTEIASWRRCAVPGTGIQHFFCISLRARYAMCDTELLYCTPLGIRY
eukprot:3940876-Rhodomonas_salina.5